MEAMLYGPQLFIRIPILYYKHLHHVRSPILAPNNVPQSILAPNNVPQLSPATHSKKALPPSTNLLLFPYVLPR
jgi:hypothetical protein